EASAMLELKPQDLVIDIGSNDGTLLSNFKSHRVLGIEPTEVGKIANSRGIPTLMRYFTPAVAAEVKREHGEARVVTAANCFAHIEDVHSVVEASCNTTPSITSTCVTTRLRASPIFSRCTGSRSFTRAPFRPMAGRSASMRAGRARI